MNIAYRTKDVRVLLIEFITYGFANARQEVHFKHRFVVPTATVEIRVRRIRVVLPDYLVYKENKALNIISDLHIENAVLSVLLFDGAVWMNAEDPSLFQVTTSDARIVYLLPPLQRPQKLGFCFNWIWNVLLQVYDKKSQKCAAINGMLKSVFNSFAIVS